MVEVVVCVVVVVIGGWDVVSMISTAAAVRDAAATAGVADAIQTAV